MSVTAQHPSTIQDKPVEQSVAVPEGLLPELVQTLALLNGIPDRIPELTIATLPFGSRSALIGYRIVEDHRESSALPPEITITPYGWQVIQACALVHPRTQAQREESETMLATARREYEQSKASGRKRHGADAAMTNSDGLAAV